MAAGRQTTKQTGIWRSIRSTMSLAWAASPGNFLSMAALSVVGAALTPAVIWVTRSLVDAAVFHDGSGSRATVLVSALLLGPLVAAQRSVAAYQFSRQAVFGQRVRIHAEQAFLSKAAAVDYFNVDRPAWHDRMTRAGRDLNFRPALVVHAVLGLLGSVAAVLFMFGLLASLDPQLMALTAASLLPGVVVQRRYTGRLYRYLWASTPDEREQIYMQHVLQQPQFAKEVRLLSLLDPLLQRFSRVAWRRDAEMNRLYRSLEAALALADLFAGAVLAGVFWLAGTDAFAGGMSPGDLLVTVGALAGVVSHLSSLSQTLVQLELHGTFLGDFYSFLSDQEALPVPAEPKPLPPRQDAGPSIEFDDVTLVYPNSETPALCGFTLRIEPGEVMAIVGENGAGKSTIIKLLLRFYDVTGGAVRVAGVDVRDVDAGELRSRMGVMFQDFCNYELTARDNVIFGRGGVEDSEAVDRAIALAGAEPVLARLPRRLDSPVGRLFETGHDLSGGEWQRLALARLFYRDGDIFLLDEPASALDPAAEADVLRTLRDHARGRTTIVISHRFSAVRLADRVAVLDGGRLEELGTHEELLSNGGRYAKMFNAQAAGYR